MSRLPIEASISFKFNNPNDPGDISGQEILYIAINGIEGATVTKYRTIGYFQDKYNLFFNPARYASKYSAMRIELPHDEVFLTPRDPADRRAPFSVDQFRREIQEDRQRHIEAAKARRIAATRARKQ